MGKEGEEDPHLPFRKKRFKLIHTLKLTYPVDPEVYRVTALEDLDRDRVLEQSYKKMRRLSTKKFLLRTKVNFAKEDGIDSGGITAEWYLLLSRAFFNPNICLFKKMESDLYTLDERSGIDDASIRYLHFFGRLMAKAM